MILVKNDDDCNATTGYKCCGDPCGITCKEPVIRRPGFCPAVTVTPEDLIMSAVFVLETVRRILIV